MIKNVVIKDSNVSFTIELTTPACPLKQEIQQAAKNAVLAVEALKQSMSPWVPRFQKILRSKIWISKVLLRLDRARVALVNQPLLSIWQLLCPSVVQKVGLLRDIYGPNVPVMMGLEALPLQLSTVQDSASRSLWC